MGLSTTKPLQLLRPSQRAGSKPRCHWLTERLAGPVPDCLTELMAPHGFVSPSDHCRRELTPQVLPNLATIYRLLRMAKERRKHGANWTTDSLQWYGRVRVRRGKRAFVYVELRADRRRKSLEQAAARLGRGGKTLLKRDGLVRDPQMADRLLRLWD